MSFRWLKRMVPRSLQGRAALILLLPIVTLQLVVSVAFIQRHVADVTRQMTRALAAELTLLRESAATDPAAAAGLAGALGLRIVPAGAGPPAAPGLRLSDLSDGIVQRALEAEVAGLSGLAFDGTRRVTVWIATPDGPLAVEFPRRRVSASNPHQLLVLMGVFGALMTLIAYQFMRLQLRPITRLAVAAEDFGKGRVTPYRPGGAAEVRAAGAAFLEMRGRIERQAQTRALMLSGVSHDLRTPLTRLKLGLAMVDDPDAPALRRDVEEMERMVEAFLDFARDDGGDALVAVDPLALVRQVVADAARGGRGVELSIGPGQDSGPVMLRPLAVRRALDNLIGNALRHGTRVAVSVVLTDRALRLTVEDDGPGIPPDQREEALRPFVRLDPARNRDRGEGVGLGLAIVADIARSHGGHLRLGQSERLGGLRADLILAR